MSSWSLAAAIAGAMPFTASRWLTDAAIVGLYALLPYFLMFVFDLVWSWLLDSWIQHGFPLVGARKLSQVCFFLTPT